MSSENVTISLEKGDRLRFRFPPGYLTNLGLTSKYSDLIDVLVVLNEIIIKKVMVKK